MADLKTDVRYIKGIGEQRARALGRLGIRTLGDLIAYFPRGYEDRRETRTIAQLQDGETACVEAMAAAAPTLSRIRRGLELVKLRAVDATGALDITFFNQAYLRDQIRAGESYVFYGRAEMRGRRRVMTNPLVERAGAGTLTGRIVPVYPLTAGVSQSLLIKAVEQGLAACRDLLADPLPDEVRRSHGLCHISYAYDEIHFPEGEEALSIARRRLVFEELFLLSAGLQQLRGRRAAVETVPFRDTDLSPFLARLPFSLTGAQRRAVGDIAGDLASGRVMNRLIEGDVGSGKTMVAAAAIYLAVKNGLQAALMAPTSILAEQHYAGLAPLLEGMGVRCGLLTGALPAAARRALMERLGRGEVDLLIGTHALLSGDVAFPRLGLVVTDEQHRFGVGQRSALSDKGRSGEAPPHLLVMSATPIPRTLALILYGDLDVSVMDELPPGRQHISTYAVSGSYRKRIYAFLDKEIAQGRQAYVVCPMVERDDQMPDERKAATEYAAALQQALPHRRIALLHGRMKPKEKERVMGAFAAGEFDILVSTTVVEVGMDVPNASVMVVENAERFGLSQLHQLRGRVGRGRHRAYCSLISDHTGEESRRRLQVMTKTNNGFAIAAADLRLRGPGNFFGRRQHGMPAMKIADLTCDARLLEEARRAAEEILRRDPDLSRPEHREMACRIRQLLEENSGAMN